MSYNLIEEDWIPVLCSDGKISLIAPWKITGDDPPLRVAAPRADFTGAITEFLIGLVQTCLPPRAERDWRKLRDSPPAASYLLEAFSKYSDAFVLDGEGPRFMQDLTLTFEEAGKPEQIASILIDSPGESTVKHNTDLFIKRGSVGRICHSCATAALFTMQAFAPSGGSGHRTSIRGGGPLTTLVLGNTLWDTVWNNILTLDGLSALGGDPSKPKEGGIFAWLAPTRMSTKGEETYLAEVHPLHKYWGMPRRVRLVFEDGSKRLCDLCNRESELHVSEYLSRPRGYNYAGSWMHPLSPIRQMKEEYLAVKGSSDGLGYQDWLGLIYREVNEKNPVMSAPVVRNYRQNRVLPGRGERADFRIWAFGYDMDNMKARLWCDGIIPAWAVVNETEAERLSIETSRLIKCADNANDVLKWAIKEAFFNDYMKISREASFLLSASARFWSSTQTPFFNVLASLARKINESEQTPFSIRQEWLVSVSKAAKEIFTHLADAESLVTMDPHGYARGWDILRNNLSPMNKRMNEILDLPSREAEA